jgi:hypothetical protein
VNIWCENVTCLNGGQCIEGANNYTCLCGNYFSGLHCEIKDEELIALENFSRSVSVAAIVCILTYILIVVSLDALKYIFRLEPMGMDEGRVELRLSSMLKRIQLEQHQLLRRKDRLNRAIRKLRDYQFHYLRWRKMKYIDESTSTDSDKTLIRHGISIVNL